MSVARHGCRNRRLVLALVVQAGLLATLSSARAAASTPDTNSTFALTAKVAAGLVDINAQLGYQDYRWLATGIVLSADGLAITTNGAIRGSTAIRVTDIANGHSYAATVTGYDISDDIAVLQFHGAAGLVTAPLASSVPTEYGLPVKPIGNGLPATKWSATTGSRHAPVLWVICGFCKARYQRAEGLSVVRCSSHRLRTVTPRTRTSTKSNYSLSP